MAKKNLYIQRFFDNMSLQLKYGYWVSRFQRGNYPQGRVVQAMVCITRLVEKSDGCS